METIGFKGQLETLFLNEKSWSIQPLKAKVVISTKTKEEEIRDHQRLVRELATDIFIDRLLLYTDGS